MRFAPTERDIEIEIDRKRERKTEIKREKIIRVNIYHEACSCLEGL